MSYMTINGKLVSSNRGKCIPKGANNYAMPKLERVTSRSPHNRAALALIRGSRSARLHDDERCYTFWHNNETDGREVRDDSDKLVLTVDHSLRFTDPVGRQVGHLRNIDGMWVFHDDENDEQFETMFSVNTATREYCWEQLERAEIAAIKFYLKM